MEIALNRGVVSARAVQGGHRGRVVADLLLREVIGEDWNAATFGGNFHVRYPSVFKMQRDQLVLVKGGPGSRLLAKAHKISSIGQDQAGKPLKVLSLPMQSVFGGFGGHVSIQRSPPRWVELAYFEKAITFVKTLKW